MTLTLARGGAKSDRHTTRHADQVEPPQAVMVGPTQAVRTSYRGYKYHKYQYSYTGSRRSAKKGIFRRGKKAA